MQWKLIASAATLGVALSQDVYAHELSTFKKILFPVITTLQPTSGLNGSSFFANGQLYAREQTRFFPLYERADHDGLVVWQAIIGTAPKGRQIGPLFCCPSSRLGRVLFVEDESVIASSGSLIASNAGSSEYLYTQLPVIRERDFRTDVTEIIGIPGGWGTTYGESNESHAVLFSRQLLRIYDPDQQGDSQVRVLVFDEFTDIYGSPAEPLLDKVITLDGREGDDPSYPGFAELPLPTVCHPLSRHTPCAPGSLRVEITPLTPGLRFWPFVTSTDNRTQRVVVYYPQ